MSDLFISPENYTPDMGPVALLSIQDAQRLKYLIETQEERIRQIEQWLKEDGELGIFFEDYDQD